MGATCNIASEIPELYGEPLMKNWSKPDDSFLYVKARKAGMKGEGEKKRIDKIVVEVHPVKPPEPIPKPAPPKQRSGIKKHESVVYIGDWLNDEFHGPGTYRDTKEGFKFVGVFQSGKASGFGTYTLLRDKIQYKGFFSEDKFCYGTIIKNYDNADPTCIESELYDHTRSKTKIVVPINRFINRT